jgi:tRNA(Ile)-lysidine synthase
MGTARPLSDAAFAAAMASLGPFEARPGIAVGVSGGADSMALALLLQRWVADRGGTLQALVVDHRLRSSSTAEAIEVQARLARLGIAGRILTRTGPPPSSGIQATARAARYALLERATAAAGFLHLAVAHHRQDQRETMALRLAAGSGPRGAAGMAPVRELDRVRLIRPLLGVEPQRLAALIAARGVPWLEDPANRDARFWRGRFRLAGSEAPVAAVCGPAPSTRQALDRELAAWLARHGRPHPLGFISASGEALSALDDDLALPLLGRLVTATAGGIWPPGTAQLQRLLRWLRSGSGRRHTLGGVVVERAARGLVRLMREPRAVAGPGGLPAQGMLWDGRFRIDRAGCLAEIVVRAAGPGWRRLLAKRPGGLELSRAAAEVPALVLETLPLLAADGLALALGPWPLGSLEPAPRVRFRPRIRYADVPFGQTDDASVVSLRESLM